MGWQHFPQLRLRHQLLQRPGCRPRVPAVRTRHDQRRNLNPHELLAARARGHGVVEDRVPAALADLEIPPQLLVHELAGELGIDSGGRYPGPDLGCETEIFPSRDALDERDQDLRAHEKHVRPEKLEALLYPKHTT